MLWLLPNLFSPEQEIDRWFVPQMVPIVQSLDGVIAESEKQARFFLKKFQATRPVHTIPVALWNEHTPRDHVDFTLEPLKDGKQIWALISDAGVPCVADPGFELVLRARQIGIPVKTVSGPSSILLALQLSGLSGQRFSFDGYLPREDATRVEVIKKLQRRSKEERSTQIVMDAPYRNMAAYQSLLGTLDDSTLLCIAREVGLPGEMVDTRRVSEWKKRAEPDLNKRPTLFLLSVIK
jgi:16S rRNA (cytidine1402-2'-O)-methyltransferase